MSHMILGGLIELQSSLWSCSRTWPLLDRFPASLEQVGWGPRQDHCLRNALLNAFLLSSPTSRKRRGQRVCGQFPGSPLLVGSLVSLSLLLAKITLVTVLSCPWHLQAIYLRFYRFKHDPMPLKIKLFGKIWLSIGHSLWIVMIISRYLFRA